MNCTMNICEAFSREINLNIIVMGYSRLFVGIEKIVRAKYNNPSIHRNFSRACSVSFDKDLIFYTL